MNTVNHKTHLKLSLGPVPYYWDRDTMYNFYHGIAESKVDIVYLGETVCSKRKLLRRDDWFELAELLTKAGKEVVLSSMTLIEANSELATLKTLCSNNKYTVEANDMAAVQLLKGQPYITGPAINIYNPNSLKFLAKSGLKRWVLPVELSKNTLEDILKEKPDNIETEVLVFGRLPLAYSARCFTARAHNLPKDDCQYRCLDYENGLLLSTQEDEKFLILNGIQTQSAKTNNLVNELDTLNKLDVDILRISPDVKNSKKIIDIFHQCIHHNYPLDQANEELKLLMPTGGSCNGYWHGISGMDWNTDNLGPICQTQA